MRSSQQAETILSAGVKSDPRAPGHYGRGLFVVDTYHTRPILMKMRTTDTYWQKVRNIAVSALADAGSDGEREVADDYLENDGCLEVPVANLERIVAYSNHPNAFNEWEQGGREGGEPPLVVGAGVLRDGARRL